MTEIILRKEVGDSHVACMKDGDIGTITRWYDNHPAYVGLTVMYVGVIDALISLPTVGNCLVWSNIKGNMEDDCRVIIREKAIITKEN